MPLTEPHRRNLSVTSRVIEQAIVEIERLFERSEGGLLTSHIALTYSREKRERIIEQLQELRRTNEEMFRDLRLDAREVDAHQIIAAKLSILWTVILDSRSNKLGRYGPLDRETSATVDQHIDGLTRIVSGLIEVVS